MHIRLMRLFFLLRKQDGEHQDPSFFCILTAELNTMIFSACRSAVPFRGLLSQLLWSALHCLRFPLHGSVSIGMLQLQQYIAKIVASMPFSPPWYKSGWPAPFGKLPADISTTICSVAAMPLINTHAADSFKHPKLPYRVPDTNRTEFTLVLTVKTR